jgi:hypothetical protein
MNTKPSDLLSRLGFAGGVAEVAQLLRTSVPLTPPPSPVAHKVATPKRAAPAPRKNLESKKSGKKIGTLTKIAEGDTVQVIITGRMSLPVIKIESGTEGFLSIGSFMLTARSIKGVMWLVTASGYGNSLDVFSGGHNGTGTDVAGHIEIRTVAQAEVEKT